MPSFTKKELQDGMITGSSKKSSRKEIEFFYSTPRSSFSVKENSEGNAFQVNDQRLKVFLEPSYNPKAKIDVIKLIAFNKFPNSK